MKSWMTLALPLLFPPVLAALLAAPLSAQPRWKALGPYGGSVESLTVAPSNPNVVYAVISPYEGPFRSVDGGLSWTPIHAGIGIVQGGVAVDARQPDTVYASFSGVPWKSVDGGDTWTSLEGTFEPTPTSFFTLLADPATPNRVYAGTSRGVWRSDDGGATWQPPQSSGSEGTFHLAAAVRRSGVVIYAGAEEGLHKSLDGGRTWLPIYQGLRSGPVFALAVAPSDPQTVYVSSLDERGLFRTRNGGETWEHIGRLDQLVFSLAVSPRRPKELWIGTNTGLFRSPNGGERWIPEAASGRTVRAVAAAPSSHRTVYMGMDIQALEPGGVFATTNGGKTWTQRNRGLAGVEAVAVAIDPQNPQKLWAGTPLLSLQRSDRGGTHWARVPLPSAPRRIFPVLDVAVAPSAPSTVYVATYRALWRTRDGGATWTDLISGEPRRTQRPTALVVDPEDPDLLWSLGDRLLRSDDGGETWSVAQGLEQACPFRSLAYAPSSPSTLYAGTSRPHPATGCGYGMAVLFRSTDGGVTWTETATAPGGGSIADLDVDPVDPQLVYAVAGFSLTDALGLWRSGDGGATWTRIPGMAERITSLTLSPLSDVLWASTLAGPVIRGTGRGESWVSRDEGLTASLVYELAIHPADPDRIFAATSGGLWMLEDQP